MGVLFGYLYSNWLSTTNPDGNFFLLQSRAFQLLLGVFIYQLRSKYKERVLDSPFSPFIGLCGLFLIADYIVFGEVQSDGPSSKNILPVLGAGLVLLSINKNDLLGKALCWKPMSLIGLLSYEIYLIHYPLISGLTIYLGGAENISVEFKLIAIVVCLIASFITHYFVTNKVRFDKSNLRAITICITGYIITACWFYFVQASNGYVPGSFAQKKQHIGEQLEGALWQYHNNTTCLDRYAFEGYTDYGWFFCYLEENKDPDIVIIGNSYANQWFPMVNNANQFKGLNILSYGNFSIKEYLSDEKFKEITTDKKHTVMYNTIKIVRNKILPSEKLKYVIITVLGMLTDSQQENLSKIRKLGDFNIILIMPHAKPEWKEIDTANCFTRKPADKCSMPISELDQVLPKEYIKSYEDFAKSLGKTYVFNPNVGYCDSGICDFSTGHAPVFRDVYHHVSVHGNNLVLPHFNDFLESINLETGN